MDSRRARRARRPPAWRLLTWNLRYRAQLWLQAVGVALGAALLLNVMLPLIGVVPPPEDDFRLAFFYPVFVLVASLVAAFASALGEMRERRLATFAALPAPRVQVALAHVLTPAVPLLAGLVTAEGLMLAVVWLQGLDLAPWRFLFLSFIAGQFLIFSQAPVLMEEVKRSRQDRRGHALLVTLAAAVAFFLLLRALSHYVDFQPQVEAALRLDVDFDPEKPASSLLVHGIAWSLIATSFWLCLRRRSMAS